MLHYIYNKIFVPTFTTAHLKTVFCILYHILCVVAEKKRHPQLPPQRLSAISKRLRRYFLSHLQLTACQRWRIEN